MIGESGYVVRGGRYVIRGESGYVIREWVCDKWR